MLCTREASEVKSVDYDQTRMEARGMSGADGGGERGGRGMIVTNRHGQPYLAPPLLLCGIRCMLGSLVDDAGQLANHFG